MQFARYSLAQAEGVLLAHTLRLPGKTLKKGRCLSAEDVMRLREAGIDEVLGVRPETGDVDENSAARQLAEALAGSGLVVGEPVAGRCNLYAPAPGLATIDAACIDAINLAGGEITVATLAPMAEVRANQALATIKVIPFAIAGRRLQQVLTLARAGAIGWAPFQSRRAALILTRSPGQKEAIFDATSKVTRERLRALGCELVWERRCQHQQADVEAALQQALAQGCDPVLISGANISVDVGDVIPAAVSACGGIIEQFGMPVEPGNMLVLARCGEQTVVNLPGCARSPRLNGLDWVLQRLVAGVGLDREAILRMGVGGLIKDREFTQRRHRERRRPRVAAVVLAAGQSRRMGEDNKLLLPVAGEPMVGRVVDAALGARLEGVWVVTGHESERVRAVLADRPVQYCDNPDYAEGIASSVRTGIEALPDTVDGAIILLGDMPFITSAQIGELVAEFNPDQERDIVAPVRGGRRGNPMVWSRRYFPALAALTGDTGGKAILRDNAANVWEVPLDDEAIFTDIDTPEALAALS